MSNMVCNRASLPTAWKVRVNFPRVQGLLIPFESYYVLSHSSRRDVNSPRDHNRLWWRYYSSPARTLSVPVVKTRQYLGPNRQQVQYIVLFGNVPLVLFGWRSTRLPISLTLPSTPSFQGHPWGSFVHDDRGPSLGAETTGSWPGEDSSEWRGWGRQSWPDGPRDTTW